MKIIYPLLISLLITYAGYSQTSGFSTLGQVFNFEVGDSLEYQYVDIGVIGSGLEHSCGGYELLTVTTVNATRDTLDYTYTFVWEDTTGGQCDLGGFVGGGVIPFQVLFGTEVYNNFAASLFRVCAPDSLTTCLWTPCPNSSGCSDSVFSNSEFNYHRQNQFVGNDSNTVSEIFADSLGLVSYSSFTIDPINTFQLQLIWYHKANGEQWGTRNSIVSGINNLDGATQAKLFPNPPNGNFSIQLSSAPQQPVWFELFDASGRKVYSQKITGSLSNVHLSGYSSGLYLWQLVEGNNVTGRGKLAIE